MFLTTWGQSGLLGMALNIDLCSWSVGHNIRWTIAFAFIRMVPLSSLPFCTPPSCTLLLDSFYQWKLKKRERRGRENKEKEKV